MQIKKLQEQQGIMSAYKQPSAKAKITAVEAQLRANSQPEEGDVKKKDGKTPGEPMWGRN